MRLSRRLLALAIVLGACSDSPSAPATVGPPAALTAVQSGSLTGRAGQTLTSIKVKVRDAGTRGVAGVSVTFRVVAGGGNINGDSVATVVSDAQGEATLPSWTLGKSAVTQTIRATAGTLTTEISATIQSGYAIDVRFFGAPMTAENQALFTSAAARIRGIITDDVINVGVASARDLAADCGLTGLPTLPAGTIDDVIIYAAVDSIDGPGRILARAGPCLVRDTANKQLPVVGIMSFDKADLGRLASGGRLQDVITHEMMHVIGVGTIWSSRGLLRDAGLETVAFTGAQAIQGCRDVGGAARCSNSVPVEFDGGEGTADGHWRESTFDSEMMTGFAEAGPMPISLITIGSLADLGYRVNVDAADKFTMPTNMALSASSSAGATGGSAVWEMEIEPAVEISPNGRTRVLPRPARRGR